MLPVWLSTSLIGPFVFQIQQAAGGHLSEPRWYREGSEGFSGDVIGAGAYGQQPVQQQGAWYMESQGKLFSLWLPFGY